MNPNQMIGRNIRPGFTPGGFTSLFGAAKSTHVRKRKDIYIEDRVIKEAANRVLEKRGIVEPTDFAGWRNR